jgi:hypothetical protein
MISIWAMLHYVDFAPQSPIFEKISRSKDVPDLTPEPLFRGFSKKKGKFCGTTVVDKQSPLIKMEII